MSLGNVILLGGVLCLLLPGSWAQMMAGGWRPADVTSEKIKQMANFSVQQYNLQSNDVYAYKMLSLKEATQQVVSGMNYKLKMVLANTICKKSEDNSNNKCPVQKRPKLKKEKCVFVVYDVPWQNSRTLTQKQCVTIYPLTSSTLHGV